MISTLNAVPEEPAQHMKDYIGLHYFSEQIEASKQKDILGKEMGIKREGLRQKDLQDLKEEIARVRMEHQKF